MHGVTNQKIILKCSYQRLKRNVWFNIIRVYVYISLLMYYSQDLVVGPIII